MSDTNFTNTTKLYDRKRPIHRINSPSYDESRPQVSGHGHDCGCRGPKDFLGTIHLVGPGQRAFLRSVLGIKIGDMREVMRTIPDWVPLEREAVIQKGLPPGLTPDLWTIPEVEHEVEGACSESRFAGSDVPFAQWHLWYDWNFFITPAKGYQYHRGLGNLHDYMEIEWDVGAFGDYEFYNSSPTPGKPKLPTPDVPGPMFGRDWAWPVSGEYMWVAGRWIYDCGHPNSGIPVFNGFGPPKLLVGDITDPEVIDGNLDLKNVDFLTIRTKDGNVPVEKSNIVGQIDLENLVQSEIHPCKAVAVGRWEAVLFKENAQPVPAIQFMFFACQHGGYVSPFKLNERDYEFIVDLPEIAEDDNPYPIGHTPDFAWNTITLRPRLLVKFDYDPFTTAHQPVAGQGQADPVIELMPAEKGGIPKQVKLRVPLTSLPLGPQSYGVIVSLGWHDPKRRESQKVKKVTVFLESLEVGKAASEFETEKHKGEAEWQMKLGVNGRWFAKSVKVKPGTSIPIVQTVEFYLADQDQISIAANGITPHGVAHLFELDALYRTIRTKDSRVPLSWEGDLDQSDPHRATDTAVNVIDQSWEIHHGSEKGIDVHDENEGRAQINPSALNRVRDLDTPNPLTMEELKKRTPAGKSLDCRLTASDDLVGEPDYVLLYQVTWDDLPNFP